MVTWRNLVPECVTVVAVTVGWLAVTVGRYAISVTAAARMWAASAAAVVLAEPYWAPLRAALDREFVTFASRPMSMTAATNTNRTGSTKAASTAAIARRR